MDHPTDSTPLHQLSDALRAVSRMSALLRKRLDGLDDDLKKIGDMHDLPPPVSDEWARVLALRLFYQNSAFHTRARAELTSRRDMLMQLYPVRGHDLVDDLQTCLHDLCERLQIVQDTWDKFVFLFDGYYLSMDATDQERIEEARPVLQQNFKELKADVAGLGLMAVGEDGKWKTVLTQAGFSHCIEQLHEKSTYDLNFFLGSLRMIFLTLARLHQERLNARARCDELCDSQIDTLFSHTATSIPVGQFLRSIERFREVELVIQEHGVTHKNKQRMLEEFVEAANCRSSTLVTLGGVQLSLDTLLYSCCRYDWARVKCVHLMARCAEQENAIQVHLAVLERTRNMD
ncbi:hypothetical protein C2E23DRAFT_883354 [Lenzites betulinus]|nr:hypothetical protein C2E23DRAFT_883354 [Lenzites betulinus]